MYNNDSPNTYFPWYYSKRLRNKEKNRLFSGHQKPIKLIVDNNYFNCDKESIFDIIYSLHPEMK